MGNFRKMSFVFITVVLMLSICGAAFGGSETTQKPTHYETVEIQSGDTIWAFAEEYNRSDLNTRAYAAYIIEFNHMTNDKIQQGQRILIPVF